MKLYMKQNPRPREQTSHCGEQTSHWGEGWGGWTDGRLELTYAAAAKLLQSCPTLCDPINGSPPGYAVPGILQARTLEWAAISFSNV